jgi:uncharacterized FlaG/YvyC family protein
MEPVNTIASASSAQQTVLARPAPTPVLQAVPTELSAAKTVTATNTVGATRNDTANNQTGSNNYQQTVLIDPATREVIYRVVDVRTRLVVRQIPDQALLRMQAYTRALANGKSTSDALTEAQADIEA